MIVKVAYFDYYWFKTSFPKYKHKEAYTTLSENMLLWRWRTPLHAKTLFPFLLYIGLFISFVSDYFIMITMKLIELNSQTQETLGFYLELVK